MRPENAFYIFLTSLTISNFCSCVKNVTDFCLYFFFGSHIKLHWTMHCTVNPLMCEYWWPIRMNWWMGVIFYANNSIKISMQKLNLVKLLWITNNRLLHLFGKSIQVKTACLLLCTAIRAILQLQITKNVVKAVTTYKSTHIFLHSVNSHIAWLDSQCIFRFFASSMTWSVSSLLHVSETKSPTSEKLKCHLRVAIALHFDFIKTFMDKHAWLALKSLRRLVPLIAKKKLVHHVAEWNFWWFYSIL